MVNRRKMTNSRRSSYALCRPSHGDVPVVSHLALTPAQMYAMSLQGKPIAANPLPEEFFVDGYSGEVSEIPAIPLDEMRGVDINDIWCAQKDYETKLTKFRRNKKSKNSPSSEITNPSNLNI